MLISDVFNLKGPEFYIAWSTLIITQTDGRTGYSNVDGQVINIQTPQAYFDVLFHLSFSDRTNNLAPNFPPPNQAPGIPWQLPQGFSNRDTDSTRVIIRKSNIVSSSFVAEFQSLRWGFQFNLQFKYLTQSGTYQAFGSTIGNANGNALYSLAFRP